MVVLVAGRSWNLFPMAGWDLLETTGCQSGPSSRAVRWATASVEGGDGCP